MPIKDLENSPATTRPHELHPAEIEVYTVDTVHGERSAEAQHTLESWLLVDAKGQRNLLAIEEEQASKMKKLDLVTHEQIKKTFGQDLHLTRKTLA